MKNAGRLSLGTVESISSNPATVVTSTGFVSYEGQRHRPTAADVAEHQLPLEAGQTELFGYRILGAFTVVTGVVGMQAGK